MRRFLPVAVDIARAALFTALVAVAAARYLL